MMGSNGEAPEARVAVLLVHGIGQQESGAFLNQFREGFGRLLGAGRITDFERHDPVDPSWRIHAVALEFEHKTAMLYEVHWADLISSGMARAAFNPVQLFPLAWFPWFNKKWQLPGFEKYSQRDVAGWTYRLVPLSVLFFLGYIGLKAVPHFMRAWEEITVVIDRIKRHHMQKAKRRGTEKPPMLEKLIRRNEIRLRRLWIDSKDSRNRERLEQAVRRTWFDKLMDQYPGDVTNFIASMAQLPYLREDLALARSFGGKVPADWITQALPQDLVQAFVDVPRRESDLMALAERARARFERAAWVAVMQDGCTEIQVLAHSLGTLVAYHALNQAPSPPGMAAGAVTPAAKLTRFYTIGCPLEKIHFFWPRLIAPRNDRPSLSGQGPDDSKLAIETDPKFRWMNYYSGSDKVSGALTRFQGWREVSNHRLAGLGGVMSAHVAYKRNAGFLCNLGEQIGLSLQAHRGGRLQTTLSWLWSTAQLLLLPLVFILICLTGVLLVAGFSLAGASLLTMLISGIGFVLQRFFTENGSFQWYGHLFFGLTAIFFASFAFLIALYVPAWAKRVARVSVARWWRKLG